MLQNRLGIYQKAAGKLCLLANGLLNVALETLEDKMDWMQASLNLKKADLWKVMKRSPKELTLSIEDNLQPSLENIQTSLQMTDKELTKMIVRTPKLLEQNFSSEKLAVRFFLLRDILKIEKNDLSSLRKVILNRREILYWSEESMLESQQWIKNRFGLEDARIAQMFRNVPNLLISKLENP